VSVKENTPTLTKCSVEAGDVPAQTVSFVITGGTDQSRFQILDGNLLQFKTAPDFEVPTDANQDNVYLVSVTASDGAGGSTVQNLMGSGTWGEGKERVMTSNTETDH